LIRLQPDEFFVGLDEFDVDFVATAEKEVIAK
jgi:hypothetical protein